MRLSLNSFLERIFLIFFLFGGASCLSSAPMATTGVAAGELCQANLDCDQGLLCMCNRCVAHSVQVYPAHCPQTSHSLDCSKGEDTCVASCENRDNPVPATCNSGLWFCPETHILEQLCGSLPSDGWDAGPEPLLDASLP